MITKRNGQKEELNTNKIKIAISKAFSSVGQSIPEHQINEIIYEIDFWDDMSVEDIQDQVEEVLMRFDYTDAAKAYILYRAEHKNARFIRERLDYMNDYISSKDNAATASETDANANVTIKNVANLEGEVYKTTNRIIQRQRMKEKLQQMFPDVANQYEKDIEHHTIYIHDEASTPTVKNYCEAVSLYPLMLEGVGNIDGITPTPPNNLDSFCGQVVNLAFLLSSQCKGAVAFGGLFVAFNYYCVKEWGNDYYEKDDVIITSPHCLKQRTLGDRIEQAFQAIVYGWNQPAGNRSYQSPFTNISYYDKNYFHALFEDFCYPDGTKPTWEQIDYLQRKFLHWFNHERTKSLLTFPVETMALLTKDGDVLDKDYKDLNSEMYSQGHSFFTYLSDNPNGLASCCRLRNEIDENVFSFTNGLSGIQTGSCNVITLNLNRIVQDFNKTVPELEKCTPEYYTKLKQYLINILERVYKYHIAYKTLLYDVEKAGMLTSSNAGYITMSKLYCTVGLNGINDAAEFLGLKCSYNEDYKKFCNLITGTIKEQNKIHSTPKFKFNQEFVPAEGLSSKNYNWDKADGYIVNPKRNLYNSYFYLADDPNTSVLDKFKMHGREFTDSLDGGVGCHINLEEHLSKKQYTKLLEFAVKQGTSYFTYNIPNSKCEVCGYISKYPITECPKCHSKNISWYTRVIGFLKAIKNFGIERMIEAKTRIYSKAASIDINGLQNTDTHE